MKQGASMNTPGDGPLGGTEGNEDTKWQTTPCHGVSLADSGSGWHRGNPTRQTKRSAISTRTGPEPQVYLSRQDPMSRLRKDTPWDGPCEMQAGTAYIETWLGLSTGLQVPKSQMGHITEIGLEQQSWDPVGLEALDWHAAAGLLWASRRGGGGQLTRSRGGWLWWMWRFQPTTTSTSSS